MASGIVMSFRPAGIRACAASGGDRRPTSPTRGGGRGSWWNPIFGWPSEPDYIDGGDSEAGKEGEGQRPAQRFALLTEEKAKELRMRTMETETFHDAMYHSAIASRLASDRPRRSSH